jgi:2-oxoglutarate ferredoxin oxidoreductase subunit gamma
MITELVFAGFGGQGVLTAGLIFSEMAIRSDMEVSWMPAYGPTMRGGKANSVVKFGDEPIGSPNLEETDVLVAMNQPSLDYAEFMKPGGIIFANTDMIAKDAPFPENAQIIWIPCTTLAKEAKNLKGANLVMLGALMKKCAFFDKAYALSAMKGFFEGKGKGKFNAGNEKAFLAGYDFN